MHPFSFQQADEKDPAWPRFGFTTLALAMVGFLKLPIIWMLCALSILFFFNLFSTGWFLSLVNRMMMNPLFSINLIHCSQIKWWKTSYPFLLWKYCNNAGVLLYVFGTFPIKHLIMFSLSLIIFTFISIIFFGCFIWLYKLDSKAA